MDIQKILLKFFNKKKYSLYKNEKVRINNKNLYENIIEKKLDKIDEALKNKENISFLHSGHLGDIINSLPLIKEVSKDKKCNLYIEINKLLPSHIQNRDHPFGKY